MKKDKCCGKKRGCCPVGPKGLEGSVGVHEDEVELFKIVSKTIKDFYEASSDLKSPLSGDSLAISIVRKMTKYLDTIRKKSNNAKT